MANGGSSSGAGKTILIGCVVIIVLILCLLGGICGYAGYKLHGISEHVQQVAQENEALRSKLNKDFPFEASKDGVVTRERLLVYLDVREATGKVWPDSQRVIEKYDDVRTGKDDQGVMPWDTFDLIQEFIDAYLGMQQKHLGFLKEHEMSFSEWAFVTYMVYNKWYQLEDSDYKAARFDFPHDLPEANKVLFAAHRERIAELALPGMDQVLIAEAEEVQQSLQPEE